MACRPNLTCPTLADKVLLEHSQVHSFTTVYGWFCTRIGELHYCERHYYVLRAKNIHHLALYGKFADPCINQPCSLSYSIQGCLPSSPLPKNSICPQICPNSIPHCFPSYGTTHFSFSPSHSLDLLNFIFCSSFFFPVLQMYIFSQFSHQSSFLGYNALLDTMTSQSNLPPWPFPGSQCPIAQISGQGIRQTPQAQHAWEEVCPAAEAGSPVTGHSLLAGQRPWLLPLTQGPFQLKPSPVSSTSWCLSDQTIAQQAWPLSLACGNSLTAERLYSSPHREVDSEKLEISTKHTYPITCLLKSILGLSMA